MICDRRASKTPAYLGRSRKCLPPALQFTLFTAEKCRFLLDGALHRHGSRRRPMVAADAAFAQFCGTCRAQISPIPLFLPQMRKIMPILTRIAAEYYIFFAK